MVQWFKVFTNERSDHFYFLFQTPSRLEPVLAGKEVLLTALNIKAMNFTGLDQDE
jgi:hypothetical protein